MSTPPVLPIQPNVLMVAPLYNGGSGAYPLRIIYMVGAPTNDIGNDGDTALDINTFFIYGPKALGKWPAGYRFQGPQGLKGDTGAAGPAGPAGQNGVSSAIFRSQNLNSRRRTIAAGDSITEGNAYRNPNGLNELSSSGWVEQALFRAKNRFTIVRNSGVGGNTSQQLRERFQTDVLAYNPTLVPIMIGTNNYATNGQMADITQCMNDLEWMIVKLLNIGCLPFIATPPAKNIAFTGADIVRASIPYYYRLTEYYGLPLLDIYKITVNPVTGDYLDGYSDDGVHPGGPLLAGPAAIGTYAALALDLLSDWSQGVYLASFSDPNPGGAANLLANGSFCLGDPTNMMGWNPGSGTVTFQPCDPIGVDNRQYVGRKMIYTQTQANQEYAMTGFTLQKGRDYDTGDRLTFSGRLTGSGIDTANAQGYTLFASFDSTSARPLNQVRQNAPQAFSQELVVPAEAGDFGVQLFIQDAGVYTFENFTLINETKMDAIFKPGQQVIT